MKAFTEAFLTEALLIHITRPVRESGHLQPKQWRVSHRGRPWMLITMTGVKNAHPEPNPSNKCISRVYIQRNDSLNNCMHSNNIFSSIYRMAQRPLTQPIWRGDNLYCPHQTFIIYFIFIYCIIFPVITLYIFHIINCLRRLFVAHNVCI